MRKDCDPLDDAQYDDYTKEAPAFTKGQVFDLRRFIEKTVKYGDDKAILYEIDPWKNQAIQELTKCDCFYVERKS